MANIKSQIKRNRQNERAHERNKAVRTALKTTSKKVRGAERRRGAGARPRGLPRLDKAASKGVVHKRTAARRKSRLAKAANRAASSAE